MYQYRAMSADLTADRPTLCRVVYVDLFDCPAMDTLLSLSRILNLILTLPNAILLYLLR